MRYEIILSPEAIENLGWLKASLRAEVRAAIERRLRYESTRLSESRIKRLRGMERPQYRLRVGDIRVFYDVGEDAVEILAIVPKADAESWLKQAGEPT